MIGRRLVAIGVLCGFVAAAGATGCGGGGRSTARGASFRVRGGPGLALEYVGRPSGFMTSRGVADIAGANRGFVGAEVRFALEYPSFVRFFVVSPRAQLYQLRSRPEIPQGGFPAGKHTVELAVQGQTTAYPLPCNGPCYLVALASPSEEMFALSPWDPSLLAPGFSNPDSLVMWVAREAVRFRDSVPWTGTYRRLQNDERR